jgi:hypothetical protein
MIGRTLEGVIILCLLLLPLYQLFHVFSKYKYIQEKTVSKIVQCETIISVGIIFINLLILIFLEEMSNLENANSAEGLAIGVVIIF